MPLPTSLHPVVSNSRIIIPSRIPLITAPRVKDKADI
jgi:hypothetical protein